MCFEEVNTHIVDLRSQYFSSMIFGMGIKMTRVNLFVFLT